ncbi:nucleotidyltransferase family protein [Novosphingobium sp. ZN18A2]|uniref:nucleotidyltransferase family protein n=1 Tax=Novosphingobium sp. ZN18A2 TaxID=3079861 RepID=UPI0030CA9E28
MAGFDAMDDFLGAALRDEGAAWPDAWREPHILPEIAARIRFHGIAPLLAERIADGRDWPPAIASGIREEARLQAFWEDSHAGAVRALLKRLSASGVEALAMKGTALAYSVYTEPGERRRGDTDLLVRERDLALARSALRAAGFAASDPVIGLLFQESWRLDTGMGFVHTIDLHWRVVDAPALHAAVDTEECFARAVSLPRLCAEARAVDPVLTFVQCCINQSLHTAQGFGVGEDRVFGGNRLGWARDNDLLLRTFSDGEWRDLLRICGARGLGPACLSGIRLARRHFATPLPASPIETLAAMPADGAAARYLRQTGKAGRFLCNLGQCVGLRRKAGFAASYLFPDRPRLRPLFPQSENVPLFVLQARRLANIAARRARRLFA